MAPAARTKWLISVAAPFAALASFEAVVRVVSAAPAERLAPIRIWRDTSQDSALLGDQATHRFRRGWLWEPRPSAAFVGEKIGEGAFRGPSYPLEPRPALRILALGESATFGMKLREADSWPRQLERSLRAQGVDAQVLNYGVIGQTIAQGVERYVREAKAWRADVVIFCYGGRNELSDVGAGANDLEKIAFFDSPSVRLRMQFDELACIRWLAQPKPSNSPSAPASFRPRVSEREYDACVARLLEETGREGARLVCLLPAFSVGAEVRARKLGPYRERICASAAAHGVLLANPVLAVRARETDSAEGGPIRLFVDEAHPNADGSRLFAETVEAALRGAGWIPGDVR